jgi:hypothetical protein
MTEGKRDDELEDTQPLPEPSRPGSCAAEPGPRDIVYKLKVEPLAGHYEPHCFACDGHLEPYKSQDVRPGDPNAKLWCRICHAHPFAISYRFVRDPKPEVKP